MESLSQNLLRYLVNHVGLPQKVPDGIEDFRKDGDRTVLQQLASASEDFKSSDDLLWCRAVRMLGRAVSDHGDGSLRKDEVLLSLANLQIDGYLTFFIAAQNAAIIVRRSTENEVIIEAFEASARNEEVLAAATLLRSFPSCAVTMKAHDFFERPFQFELASLLERMSSERLKPFAAKSRKAGVEVEEIRDTTDPQLVTQMLMTHFEALGKRISVPPTYKRTKDEVSWNKVMEPWRRSPMWLVIRVGLQRALGHIFGLELGLTHYKNFMIWFLTKIVRAATTSPSIPAYVLQFLCAKLSRRILKVQKSGSLSRDSTETAELVLTNASAKLESGWTKIKHDTNRHVTQLPRTAQPTSLKLSLHASSTFLSHVLDKPLVSQESRMSELPCHSRHKINSAGLPEVETVSLVLDQYVCLHDVEEWTRVQMESWRTSSSSTDERCSALKALIDSYSEAALKTYQGDCTQLSMMILTIMDIWVTLDQCTVELYPLLLQFDPEVKPDLLYALEVERVQDMHRMHRIEAYIEYRINLSRPMRNPSIFSKPSPQSFATNYFQSSWKMQQHLALIHERTAEETRQKRDEWASLDMTYRGLLNQSESLSCSTKRVWSYSTDEYVSEHDDRNCRKCYLKTQAERMNITVYEAPLPTNLVQARTAIFELRCPEGFAAWRDSTWMILQDLGSDSRLIEQECYITLSRYQALQNERSGPSRRLTIASEAKPFVVSHYRIKPFPCGVDDVCKPNGLVYEMYDDEKSSFTRAFTEASSFMHHCVVQFPSESQRRLLLPVVNATTHTSNEVIASQTRCPANINIHEWLHFQDVRCGWNLQWPKILRELASANIDMGTPESTALFRHAALQAGPNPTGDVLRAAHWVFQDDGFCLRMISQIKIRFESIRANWKEVSCMETLIILLTRTLWLSRNSSLEVVDGASNLLLEIRSCTLEWVRVLRIKLAATTDSTVHQKLEVQILVAASLCRRTYAFVAANETAVLNVQALSVFMECSIQIFNNTPKTTSQLDVHVRGHLAYGMKLALAMEHKFHFSVESDGRALESALAQEWPGAHPFGQWKLLPSPRERWITTLTCSNDQQKGQHVHFNLVSGCLLVDGLPIGRLPSGYTSHPLYERAFGGQILNVLPSRISGMTHRSTELIEGHELHFGMRGDQLVIRTISAAIERELLPHYIFKRADTDMDLPHSFVYEHVHWLDLKTGIVEIVPQQEIWKSNKDNWRINVKTKTGFRGEDILVDPSSGDVANIAGVIGSFEERTRLVVYQPKSGGLTVNLPRFDMSFFVNHNGWLESRELRAIVDSEQSIGTLHGLLTMLVLRDTSSQSRSIMIPRGGISFGQLQGHSVVKVSFGVSPSVSCCRYAVNDLLHRLDPPTEMYDLLYIAYLHALTSHGLVDELTCRTGTEEALYCLESAYLRMWKPLDGQCIELLKLIAGLTPSRTYYPKHLKSMQVTQWNKGLSANAQDDHYHYVAETLLAKSKSMLYCWAQSDTHPADLNRGPSFLLKRSQASSQRYKRPDSGIIPKFVELEDRPYEPRHEQTNSEARNNTFEAVSLIKQWNSNRKIATERDLIGVFQGWGDISGFHETFQITLLEDLLTLQIPKHWGSLYQLCQRPHNQAGRHKLSFMFSVIAFRNDADMAAIRTLIAISVGQEFSGITPPAWHSYTGFRHGLKPTLEILAALIMPLLKSFDKSTVPVSNLNPSDRNRAIQRASTQHERDSQSKARELATTFLRQWPCQIPSKAGIPTSRDYDSNKIISVLSPSWLKAYQCYQLSNFAKEVQTRLLNYQSTHAFKPQSWANPKLDESRLLVRDCAYLVPSLRDLLRDDKTSLPPFRLGSIRIGNASLQSRSQAAAIPQSGVVSPEHKELYEIIFPLTDGDGLRQEYGNSLMDSLKALQTLSQSTQLSATGSEPSNLAEHIDFYRAFISLEFNTLVDAFEEDERCRWLKLGNLWPSVSPTLILACLSKSSSLPTNESKFEFIINYAVHITELQRLLRIKSAQSSKATVQLNAELQNEGHEHWSPKDYPSWLLIEIESNVLIRPKQFQVAKEMIAPSSNSNSLMQLNMGQGKSSLIIPMIASVLADARRIVRVIVPRALLLQMAGILGQRLSGLLRHPLFHVPWSRQFPTDSSTIQAFKATHLDCLTRRGIMLAVPEHILSFRLSGRERLSVNSIQEAKCMLEAQNWIDSSCRDILDESDHLLSVKNQLIYTVGSQLPIDGHPIRWQTSQRLLHLIKQLLPSLRESNPQALKVEERPRGGFPTIHILRKEVEDILLQQLAQLLAHGERSLLPLQDMPNNAVQQIKEFLLKTSLLTAEALSHMKDEFSKKDLLLLRGLLVHRILPLALSKRWNVNYGQHPTRCLIAVPYLAKGVPSANSEFGHADVAVLLTCLSYYYSGLSLSQMRQSIIKLLSFDDPAIEYDTWVASCGELPSTLHSWTSINIDDDLQVELLWEYLARNMAVVDHYLNHFVFPNEAKQFEKKLVTNAMDLVLTGTLFPQTQTQIPVDHHWPTSINSEVLPLTTGFSGTNDTRGLLPSTIKQRDLEGLAHTNAEVLCYLLQPRNRSYVRAQNNEAKRLAVGDLLRLISCQKPSIHVILDAGAQVLDMSNDALVTAWLELSPEAPAAVFFSSADRLMIMHRDGRQESLAASRFADDLSGCLVYLDEAHTRGTDLKLPPDTRAALTLGPGLTKDHAMQAAMRLRQLAYTQSVVFFAPPEVDQSILDLLGKDSNADSDSNDVIRWLLEQTCLANENHYPLYLSQGLNYFNRQEATLRNPQYITDETQRKAYLAVLEERESFTLDDMYNPTSTAMAQLIPVVDETSPHYAHVTELIDKREAYGERLDHNHSSIHEEQERELAVELETERQLERPPAAKALAHVKDPELKVFVQSGILKPTSHGFRPAFDIKALKTLSMLQNAVVTLGGRLWATADFHATIVKDANHTNDDFQRPVHWVLWSTRSSVAVLISPFEADYLLPELRNTSNKHVHLLTYAAASTRRMLSFDSLTFYVIPALPEGWQAPPWLVRALGLFAGRLYFKFGEYSELCRYLGLPNPVQAPTQQGAFLAPAVDTLTFTGPVPPLSFLWEWLTVRRKGMDFGRTPMGNLIRSRRMAQSDAVFAETLDVD